jgi:hypothetical protein
MAFEFLFAEPVTLQAMEPNLLEKRNNALFPETEGDA